MSNANVPSFIAFTSGRGDRSRNLGGPRSSDERHLLENFSFRVDEAYHEVLVTNSRPCQRLRFQTLLSGIELLERNSA